VWSLCSCGLRPFVQPELLGWNLRAKNIRQGFQSGASRQSLWAAVTWDISAIAHGPGVLFPYNDLAVVSQNRVVAICFPQGW